MIMKTSLYKEHSVLHAKFVQFAGWEMPVMYTSILEEHNATRTKAALFDVSHMGELIVRGPNAPQFLSLVIPTRLDKIMPGKTMYSVLCNEKGGVVDDLFIYMKGQNEYFIVVNAGTKNKDVDWLRDHAIPGIEIIDLSDTLSKIDLQGPMSRSIANNLFGEKNISSLKRFHFIEFLYQNYTIMMSQTGYTGELGYEIYMENSCAPLIWKTLLAAGADLGVTPAGLGARDTLRLEACYSLYGHELSETITPVEAGLGWLISSDAAYIGKDIVTSQLLNGAPRKLIVFEMADKRIPREEYQILKNGVPIGVVTSGTFSPTFQKGIGMGLVANSSVTLGDAIDIVIRDKPSRAIVVKRPLYQYKS